MNSLASIGTTLLGDLGPQAGLVATLAMPLANANPVATSAAGLPGFDNMFSSLLNADQGKTQIGAAPQATPSQIADAMIRSMLGDPGATTSANAAIPSAIPSDPKGTGQKNTNTNPDPILLAPAKPDRDLNNLAIVTMVVVTPVPLTILPQVKVVADSTAAPVQNNILTSTPTTVAILPKIMPDAKIAFSVVLTPVQTAPTAQVAVSPVPVIPEPALATVTAPVAVLTPVQTAPTAPVAATAVPVMAPPALATVTGPVAMLTPLQTAPTAPAAASAVPVIVEPVLATVKAPASEPVASAPATPSSTATLTAVEGLTSQTTVSPTGQKSTGDSSQQQQQSGSQDAPAQPTIAAEPKVKPAAEKHTAGDPAPAIAVRDASPTIAPMSIAPVSSQSHTAAATPETGAPAAAPFHSTAETLRTSESNFPSAPVLRTGAAQEIAIRITPPDAPAVDLRIVEKAGQVHVDVRTADVAMQTSLRQDLGTLTNSLQRAGYHAEMFTPSSTLGRMAPSAQTGNQDQQDSSRNRGGSGDFSGDRRQQQQKRSGTWLEELEEQ